MSQAVDHASVEELEAMHRALKTELHALERRAYLTPTEQVRARVLKKLKLRTKDRIARVSSAPPPRS